MKKISALIFCFTTIIFLAGGCAVWKDLNTPIGKRKKTTQPSKAAAYEPATFPDGSAVGLNKYEKAYVNDINKKNKYQEKQNYRKVFGGSGR